MSRILEAFLSRARSRGDAPAFEDEAGPASYADVARRVETLAVALERAGVVAGDVVVVETARTRDAMPAALAVRARGGVPLLRPPGTPTPAIARHVVTPDGGAAAVGAGPRARDARLPEGTAWLGATGGSTGEPRLVALAEEQVLTGVLTRAALLSIAPGDAVVVTAAASSAYGSMTGGLALLLAGARVRPAAPHAPRGVIAAAGDDARWLLTTAPFVRALARLPRLRDSGAPLRALVAAAPYPGPEAEVVRAVHGIDVIDRYGATETGPIAQAHEPGGPLHAAPGVTVRLMGEPAIVEVESGHVALGYLGGARFEGRFRTGDLGRSTPDGGFRLLGRSDRVVRRAGRPVDLDGVERTLLAMSGVARARVRTAQGTFDLDLVAQVVPRDAASLDVEALVAALHARLAPHERPSRIEVVAAEDAGPEEKWRSASPPP